MKNTLKGLVMIYSFFLGGTAHAQNIDKGNPHIGIGAGYFSANHSGGVANKSLGTFLIGGADFSDYLGAELRLGLMNHSASKSNVEWFASTLLKARYPVSDRLEFYALGGVTTAQVAVVPPSTSTITAGTTTAGVAPRTTLTHFTPPPPAFSGPVPGAPPTPGAPPAPTITTPLLASTITTTGGTAATTTATTIVSTPSTTLRTTEYGFSYGIGVSYKIDDSFSSSIEYVQYWRGVGIQTGTKMSISSVSGNLTYRF